MKPSIEEVFNSIVALHFNKRTKKIGVSIENLTEYMDEHVGNIMPSLLLLAREKQISIKSVESGILVVLRNNGQAA